MNLNWTGWIGLVLGLGCLLTTPAIAQSPDTEVVAIVDGAVITRGQVTDLAADALEDIQNDRLRFEAESRSQEHQVIQNTLNGMITDRVLNKEADVRGISVGELLALEVESRVVEPTEAEIQEVYQVNLQQLANLPRAEGLARVRQFLVQQSYDLALVGFVEGLREDYGVESRLGPYRIDVVTDGYPTRGPEDAPVVIVEFSDFECPYCRQAYATMEQIQEVYSGRIRFVYRQFPLDDIHPRAQKAAEASLCAHEQDAFWPMHDLLFAEPIELETASLKVKANTLGLDTVAFNTCLDTGRYAEQVNDEISEGIRIGVSGTPTVIINGRPMTGVQPYEAYATVIEEELAAATPSP